MSVETSFSVPTVQAKGVAGAPREEVLTGLGISSPAQDAASVAPVPDKAVAPGLAALLWLGVGPRKARQNSSRTSGATKLPDSSVDA